MYFSLRNVVAVCSVIFVLAVGFVIVADSGEGAALFHAFRALPLLAKAAWAVIVIVPFVLLLCAVWLSETVLRQRQASHALALRLDGVRDGVKSAAKSQGEAEAAVRHLVRTDPEDAIAAMQQRLTEAERIAQVQQGRNEVGDLPSRVDDIRNQQRTLQERLVPVLEKRRSIEKLFMDLDSRQHDIERALAEVASGDDAIALENGLNKMVEFVKQSHARCDDVERAAKMTVGLTEEFAELRTRIAPFTAAGDGVASRVKELSETRERLAADIESLLKTSEGPLAERVQKFAADKRMLGGRLSELNEGFSKLATLRKDIGGLFASFDRALDVLAMSGGSESGVDVRVEELTSFIAATQAQLDDVERRRAGFEQLRTKLGELRARLLPLESEQGGLVNLIGEIRDTRDQLAAKIKHLEESDDGSLAERVKKFGETRRELEEQVSNLTEQFSRLATIRKDIAGLFEKLTGVAGVTAN